MKLAAQLYTVRDFTKTEADIEKTLSRIRAIGYRGIQISCFGPYKAENVAKMCQDNGLEVCATHTALDRIVNDTDRVIEEHKILGCPTVGLGSMPGYEREAMEKTLADLAPAVEKLHAAGLYFVLHNHWKEFVPYGDGKTPLDLLFSAFPADRVGLLLDFYWLVYACRRPLAFIQQYADRIGTVHFKDMKMNEKGDRVFCEIYDGCIDYTAIYYALAAQGGKWVAVEQDACDGDPFESLARSFNNIKAEGLPFENI